jgi:hydroxymethylglutaryl-CoA reductase
LETEVLIPRKVLSENYGNISPKDVGRINFIKNYQGSALAGTLTGYNANVANTVAALFAATG